MKQHGKMTVLLLAAIWGLTAGSLPTAAQRVRPWLSNAMITTMAMARLDPFPGSCILPYRKQVLILKA